MNFKQVAFLNRNQLILSRLKIHCILNRVPKRVRFCVHLLLVINLNQIYDKNLIFQFKWMEIISII